MLYKNVKWRGHTFIVSTIYSAVITDILCVLKVEGIVNL